ncbi:toxin-antitoxin system YwqK family antitoxin [Mongoliitalea lutea]|uniref:Antitoxin component YwqK of the YwqJK toxin-antitoxin module n=1 Tax=Mongoliitalea lutea TaxID=849756 RepID=A0A8J3CVX0_9BACT|nr:toxin-antitoxin system YwqK family antitoxin [Mongoliitalea lutea]GHB31576.1 hypothetical protein GCM10008106_10550 [Mongoliitalea lutea]
MRYIFVAFFLLNIATATFAQNNPNVVSIFNSDSTLVGTGILRNGLMEGLWRFENPRTRQLIQTINFEAGIREGLLTTFQAGNVKRSERQYRNNKLNGSYREFDSTGALILEMSFADSIPVGSYKEYFGRDGNFSWLNPRQVKLEGQYQNGKREGQWVSFYDTGELLSREIYKDGRRDGPYREFFPQGDIMVEVDYRNGEPHGPYTRFAGARLVAEKGTYDNGKKIGEWISYFPGTKSVESRQFFDNRGNRTGEWKFFYENGRTARIERYENDLPTGTWEEFFPNRRLSKRMIYSIGVPVGEYIENHANGKISVKGQYSNGAKDGLWISYFPEGTVYSAGEYRNDLKTGLWKYFNKIGILIAEGEYSLGSENGQWFYYYDGGQLKSVGTYFLGFENGVWGLFYDNKQLTQEEFWDNGRLMNVGEYFSYDGSTTYDKGTLSDGNGSRITYYTSGTKESEGMYVNGKADGTWVYFHENGRKASEGQMKDGKKEGPWRYFNIAGRLEQIINFKDDEIVPDPSDGF